MKLKPNNLAEKIHEIRFVRYMYTFFSILDASLLALIFILLISPLIPKTIFVPLLIACINTMLYSLVAGIASAKIAELRLGMIIQLFLKRLFDFIFSGVGLLFLAPMMLLIMILIFIDSPGTVLFKQRRVGLGKREYILYKFRSMRLESFRAIEAAIAEGKNGKQIKRIYFTRVGRVLRQFSLDELPQLFNVFKGDMSIVGPRPIPPYEGCYRDDRTFAFLPGITCLWQVSGRYNISFQDWLKLDMDYVTNWSIILDIKILLKTFTVPFTNMGRY